MSHVTRQEQEESGTETRTCPRCGTRVPLQKTGVAVGIRPCPNCGRPISVRSKTGGDVFVDDAFSEVEEVRNVSVAQLRDTVMGGPETVPWPVGHSTGAVDDPIVSPPSEPKKPRRRLVVLFAVAAAALVIGIGLFSLGSWLSVPVESNLEKIARAFKNYIQKNNGKLPHSDVGPKGELDLSWRVHLLPYFDDPELEALHKQFHMDEPWDSTHNAALIKRMPAVYRSPEVISTGWTSLHVFTGRGTPFGAPEPHFIKDCIDGLEVTILAIQAGSDVAEPWTKPGGLMLTPDPLTNVGRPSHGGFTVVMMDGKVRQLWYDLNPEYAKALIMHDDLQTLDVRDLEPNVLPPTRPSGAQPVPPPVAPVQPPMGRRVPRSLQPLKPTPRK